MKKRFIQIVAFVLLLGLLPINSKALVGYDDVQFDVIALGDSLAAGVTPENGEGPGYGDFLASMLDEFDALGSFNKGFAVPGAKTTGLLKDLEENVVKPSVGLGIKGESTTIEEAIEEAEVIVMSIGANDVLSTVKLVDGKLEYDIPTVSAKISEVAKNIETIFEEIYAINPDVQIVFMGYYNPFPYLTDYSFILNTMVTMFDDAVKVSVEKLGGTFVPVKDEVAKNFKSFLPNPSNIHLSEDGYKYVAEQMYNELPLIHIANPSGIPGDIIGHWGENDIMLAIEAGLFKGYEDNTFRPENPLSRIEMAALLNRGLKLPTSSAILEFTDLGDSYPPMVQELRNVYGAGIVKGDGSGKFLPNNHITREQMALMLLRAFEFDYGGNFAPELAGPYQDTAHLSEESKAAISFLYEQAIIDPADAFRPSDPLKRAEAAKMLVKFNEVINFVK